MSNRNALASLVQNKLQTARQRITQETQNLGSLEQAQAKAQLLGDYQLYFQGASEALSAIGLDADDLKSVALAARTIESEIQAEEAKALLEEELRSSQ
jgi:hypothetical protein